MCFQFSVPKSYLTVSTPHNTRYVKTDRTTLDRYRNRGKQGHTIQRKKKTRQNQTKTETDRDRNMETEMYITIRTNNEHDGEPVQRNQVI